MVASLWGMLLFLLFGGSEGGGSGGGLGFGFGDKSNCVAKTGIKLTNFLPQSIKC